MGDRLAARKHSVLLLGPRQVGKSTLCRSLKPDVGINLASEAQMLRYAKDPGRLARELSVASPSALVFIDEVQRVPALLNEVQVLLDAADTNGWRFLLTGSSARKLKRGRANLLPGRIVLEHLDPLSALELPRAQFDLGRALQRGMLPAIYLGGEEELDVLGSYAEVYLREEIRAEALAKDLGSYARFLDVAAIVSGTWLNYSKIASDSEIPKETIRRFVGVLEDTLMVFRIPPFRPKTRISRRVSQRDRFVLFDVGVRNALLGLHRRPPSADQLGGLFEQWLILQILTLNRAARLGWSVSSYRTQAGAEVDVVLERAADIVGIEIKASRSVRRAAARGLQSLAETIGDYKPLVKRVAFLGERAERVSGDVVALPYLELLEELWAGGE